jgi:hypothetical protein
LVPEINGARPVAPPGGHSSQAGALLDRVVVPVAEELLDPVLADVVPPPVPAALDPPPPLELDPPPPLEVDPVAELPDVVPVVVAVAGLVCVAPVAVVVIVGNVTAPYGLARVVPAAAPVVAVVCAATGGISATNSGNTKINGLIMSLIDPSAGFPPMLQSRAALSNICL